MSPDLWRNIDGSRRTRCTHHRDPRTPARREQHAHAHAGTLADGRRHRRVPERHRGARAYSATSLSTPIGDAQSTELGDTLGGEDAAFGLVELRIALGPAVASLDEREQKILSLRFYGNQTQTEIAEQLGISHMHVSRLLTRALGKLRVKLDA